MTVAARVSSTAGSLWILIVWCPFSLRVFGLSGVPAFTHEVLLSPVVEVGEAGPQLGAADALPGQIFGLRQVALPGGFVGPPADRDRIHLHQVGVGRGGQQKFEP